MTNRWSNARQGVIDNVRMSIVSKGCTYAILGLEGADKAATVKSLLDDEVFHFGKANSVSDFWHETNIFSLTVVQPSGHRE